MHEGDCVGDRGKVGVEGRGWGEGWGVWWVGGLGAENLMLIELTQKDTDLYFASVQIRFRAG